MKLNLKTKLSFSYILLAMICIFLISVAAKLLIDKQFSNYIIQSHEKTNKQIISLVGQQYNEDGSWETDVIKDIGMNSLEQGLIIKVTDKQGRIVWDATSFNSDLCKQMISNISQNMSGVYPDWKGGYIENRYSIDKNFKEVGVLEIGYLGPFYYNDEDLFFIKTLYKVIFSAGIVSLIIALIFGDIMARRISKPISRVIDTAQSISKGNYLNRISERSNIREINQLTTTINDLAENIKKQEMLRKRLTQDVAHELRTPLATLQGHMEAIIDGIWKPDIQRFKSCHEEILRINDIVKDLERLAKYENENLTLNKTEFDLKKLIRSVISNFGNEFLEKQILVNCVGIKEIILADEDKIKQVITNIISNALKYTPVGGTIEVDMKNKDKHLEINIKDNGIGISQQDLPYIFERFYREDKSRNRLTGGAGIGLTTAKAIVGAHKGEIRVESELGRGSIITILLPR